MSRLEWEDLTPAQQAFISNGCGNSFMNVPDFEFEDICRKHDFGYWLGHTKEDRSRVDWEWCVEMLRVSNKFSWWKRSYLKATAWVYYKAVRAASWRWFNFSDRYKTIKDLEEEMKNA